MTAWKMSPVIDAFQVVFLPTAKQRIFNHTIQHYASSSCYQLISAHFREKHVMLLQTVAK